MGAELSLPERTFPAKPCPVPLADDQPYWEGLQRNQVVLHKCLDCGSLRQRADIICYHCQSEHFAWTPVRGHGKIYSFTTVWQTWVEGFQDSIPYVIAAVSIDEWPSLLITANLVGDVDPGRIVLDAPVEPVFERRGHQALLQFQLRK